MEPSRRVLIVEDDAHIAELLRMHLRDEGYAVEHAADGHEGMRRLEEGGWDALVLDLMLPGVDGLEICKRARGMARYTPIIITSARSSEVHRILGLELGADDYLAKPFSMLELVAVRALLRRSDALARNARMDAGTLELHGLAIDPVARTALLDGRALDLTPREFDLLHFFARHPDKVYSRLDLLNQVWGYQHEGYEHTVNTHINRLRTKIEDDPSEPRRILTVWGAATVRRHAGRGMIKRLSLTQRLSAVFALLLLACCGASAWLQMAANARYEQEVVQRLSGGLAGHIAGANELMDAQGWKPEAVRALFDKLMAVNPAVEVYLLDLDGRVVGDAAPPGQLLDRVDLAPLRALAGGMLPIMGDDPRNAGARKVFSVARRRQDIGYVYVVLQGQAHDDHGRVAQHRAAHHAVVDRAGGAAGPGGRPGRLRPDHAGRCADARGAGLRRRQRRAGGAGGWRQGRRPGWRPDAARGGDEIVALRRSFAQMGRRISEQWRELTRQDQQRRDMVANISHDLRTPLTSLHGYLETLRLKDATLEADERRATWTSRWRKAARWPAGAGVVRAGAAGVRAGAAGA